MSSVKAALTVVLKANDVVVAEVEDAMLWQQVFASINSGSSKIMSGQERAAALGGDPVDKDTAVVPGDKGAITQMAAQLGIDVPVLAGACSPSLDGTFLHLDSHCWEVMKKQIPPRGFLAVAPLAVTATLLSLWFAKANLGIPTQAQAQAVLGTISLKDPNGSRSIENTIWLQRRSGGQIVINPAEISQAIKLAKCFCLKDWSSWKGTQA